MHPKRVYLLGRKELQMWKFACIPRIWIGTHFMETSTLKEVQYHIARRYLQYSFVEVVQQFLLGFQL
jgi:hypothetical protein